LIFPKTLFAIPGTLSTPTGGYEYARRVLQALPELVHLPLPDGFPSPDAAALRETAARLAAVPHDTVLLIDGLAFGALPSWCLDQIQAPIVALVHHPLCLESGLTPAASTLLRASETAALARAARIITTSASTAALLAQAFGVTTDRLVVAEPGIDPAPQAMRDGNPPRLLAVGAVVPRKGYDHLIAALAALRAIPWRLQIVGTLDRDQPTATRLHAAIKAAALAERVQLTGAVDAAALQRSYQTAGVFVTTSLHEGFGMAAAEAIAHGLPLVASRAGALTTTIPSAAAMWCEPGDVTGLRNALYRMLTDRHGREACAAASWRAASSLPKWPATTQRIAAVLSEVRRGA
jgi:glycosyltransferase involved in cell wall biosynthesis